VHFYLSQCARPDPAIPTSAFPASPSPRLARLALRTTMLSLSARRATPTTSAIAPIKNKLFPTAAPFDPEYAFMPKDWDFVIARLKGTDLPNAERFFAAVHEEVTQKLAPHNMVFVLDIIKARLAGLETSKHPHLLFSPECYIYCKWFTLYTPCVGGEGRLLR